MEPHLCLPEEEGLGLQLTVPSTIQPPPALAPALAASVTIHEENIAGVDWEKRYSTGWAYGKAPNDFLVEAIALLIELRALAPVGTPIRVLSLGEGQGRNVVYLASKLGCHCVAVDSSHSAARSTQRLAAQRSVAELVETVTADLTSYSPAAESFDLIISIFSMLPPPYRSEIHTKCVHALRPNGFIIVECFSSGQAGLNRQSLRRMGPSEACLVDKGQLCGDFTPLEVILSREMVRPLHEGKFHRGTAACIQFLAVKSIAATAVSYHASVNAVFEEHSINGGDIESSVKDKYTDDKLLCNASFLLNKGCEAAERSQWCRYCWCSADMCVCPEVASLSAALETPPSLDIHWVFVIHPNEFLRSTSSAKYAAQCLAARSGDEVEGIRGSSSEIIVYGCMQHEYRLQYILDRCKGSNDAAILYPDDALPVRYIPELPAIGVADFLEAGRILPENRSRKKIILVPDGSWANAAQLACLLHRPNGRGGGFVPLVSLNADAARAHFSPLIEALKAGQGLGRLSTLEACALFLREGGYAEQAHHLLAHLLPVVNYVRRLHPDPSLGHVSHDDWTPLQAEEAEAWTTGLQRAAHTVGTTGLPTGLRRCLLCGENLATPARMDQHLKGRKHCAVVARRLLLSGNKREAGRAFPSVEACLGMWERHSVLPMAKFVPEPPDVALQALKEYLAVSSKKGMQAAACKQSAEMKPDAVPVEHVVSKGERMLAIAAKPQISADLPPLLRQQFKLKFSPSSRSLYEAVVQLLLDTPRLGRFSDLERPRLEQFVPSANIFRSFKDRQVLYNAVEANEAFLDMYERLVLEAVCPHLKRLLREVERNGDADVETSVGEVCFWYQYPPSLRLQSGNSSVFGRVHRDVEYGHQAGEVNLWMPLTNVLLTETTLWAESEPGKGDFKSLDVNYGDIAMFHGSLCHHYVPPNQTDNTRVSMDFRIGVGDYFDSQWALPGLPRQHGRRKGII